MFKSLRIAGLFAFSAVLAASSMASAQTAPQLVPYTARLIAGSAATSPAAGTKCPVSGNTSLDAYGDGCLATEVNLGSGSTGTTGGPRFAVADKNGNIFFGDFVNSLVRRVDAITGVITTVAGGATSSPAIGTACGTGLSISSDGDGCPANLVKLSKPAGVAFDAAGNLYFTDNGFDNIRMIAATGGLITTTGIITHIAGNTTFGYSTNNGSGGTPVLAATAYLNFPYGIAFDAAGNLYVADEGNNAISVINMGTTARTIQGVSVPAGTIQKISGLGTLATKTATGECPNFVSTSARGGCYFGKWTDGSVAAASNNDGVYAVAVDSSNNLYFSNEFNDNVGFITPANIISTYAGIQGTVLKKLTNRGTAGSFAIGSVFGVALDPQQNLYVTDASSGGIWRVDATTKVMYPIAGSATGTAVCAVASDTLGDGCPALGGATFGSSGSSFASTTLPGPGIYGISADATGDVFVGDTENANIREVASGTQFGRVGVNVSTTDVLDLHFIAGDSPAASGAYTITAGSAIFTLGTANCTTNSPDGTTDCLLPLIARPTTLGAFTGTLVVKSGTANGGTSTFPLSGYAITIPPVPATRTVVSYTTGASAGCTTTTTITPTTSISITATVVSNGSPTGTVTFFAGTTQIGTGAVSPSGVATLTTTISTPGTYTIKAVYSGDTFFTTSTGTATPDVTIQTPGFTTSIVTAQENTVTAGGTALYSFTINQAVYTGTITSACTGLPAGATCTFSPNTITATGCSTTNTVAVSIFTTQPLPIKSSGFGTGRWSAFGVVAGFGLALMIGLRRRRNGLGFGGIALTLALLIASSGLIACGNGNKAIAGTPAGTYTVTVTTTGSTGLSTNFTVPLTVK